jgi:hypothetical protein
VNKTAETVPASDRGGDGDNVRGRFGAGHRWRPKIQASMRSLIVVVPHILVENCLKVAPTPDQQPIQAFLSDRPHPALSERVGPSRQMHPMTPVGTVLFG